MKDGLKDGIVKANARDFHILSCYYQAIITIRDYLEQLAKDGCDSVSVDMMAILAGCIDEVAELRKECKEAKENGEQ